MVLFVPVPRAYGRALAVADGQVADAARAAGRMKRSHRRWHLPLWLVVAGWSAGVLALVVSLRSSVVVNADLPAGLVASDSKAPVAVGR